MPSRQYACMLRCSTADQSMWGENLDPFIVGPLMGDSRSRKQVRVRHSSNWMRGDNPSDIWSPTDARSEDGVVATSQVIGSIPVRRNITIAHLPMELLLCIIEQMDHHSLQNVSLLNKSFRQIANPLLFHTVQFNRGFGHACRESPTAMFLYTRSICYVAPWCTKSDIENPRSDTGSKGICSHAMRLLSFKRELEYLATVLHRCRKLRSLKMRWEPCQQRRSCTQAPLSRQSLEWPLRVLVAAMNRGACKAESLESLSVDVFQSQHTIHELDMAAEFWTAVSEVKDLTLRGQFGFWEPVLTFSPGRGLRSIRLSDCAVWHHNLKSFAERAIDWVISIRLEKVFIRPYRELGYVTHMGSPIEMVNWLDHVVSSRTNQANIDHPVGGHRVPR